MKEDNLKNLAGYILICLLWGSTWIFIKIGLKSLTPIFAAGIRFLIAAGLILILMKIFRLKLQTDKASLKIYFVLTLFSFSIPFALVYWGQQFIPAGLSSIIFGVFPFWVILFSLIMIPEKNIGPYQLLGTVLGFSGIVVIFSEHLSIQGISGYMWGILAVLVSSALQSFATVSVKKFGKEIHPLSINFIPILLSGIGMTAYGLTAEDISYLKFDSNSVISIGYLAVFGTIGTFTTYYWLMKRINVVILSLVTFIEPVVAVFLGYIILNEELTLQTYIGSVMVLCGILFANLRGLINYYSATFGKPV